MRFLLFTIGSRGDVQPLIVLGRELRRRGHEVAFAAPPNFEGFIEAEGFSFRPVGCDTHALLAENGRLAEKSPLAAVPEHLALVSRELEQHFDQLFGKPEHFDLVVSAGLALVGRSLAEHWGVSYAYLFYTLSGVPSAAHPPAAMPIFGLPRWGNRLLWAINRWLFDASLGRVLNRGRERHGLTTDASPWNAIHRDRGLLVQDELVGALPRDSWALAQQVPALLEQTVPPPRLPADLLEFLEVEESDGQRSRAIYLGFGSMPTVERSRVVRTAIEFHESTGRPVLLFSAHTEDAVFRLPRGVRPLAAIDHRSLFPRLSAVVHHGGAGTLATALRAGAPQVIVPHIVDQFFHARRVFELGVGPRPLHKSKLTAETLREAVDFADSCRERAESVAATIASRNGPAEAALVLEGWAGSRSSGQHGDARGKGPPHPLSSTVAPFQAWRGSRRAVGGPIRGFATAELARPDRLRNS